ncbi:hypothetical protein LCGC14_1011860 [marine sediment metagenome]|uniref:Helix-turn-helix type 11 domain-containing protein n=1 Tax=marine sediment metagenome TaxID=412755 RepID=A0A0F9N053_9ZZZZ
MGQQEIYKLMKKKDKWMSCREISECVGTSQSTASTSLRKLHDQKEILRKNRSSQYLKGVKVSVYLWRIKPLELDDDTLEH